MYMSEINQFPLLTREEEFYLGKLILDGKNAEKKLETMDISQEEELILKESIKKGLDARNKLIESNFRLVVSRTGRFKNYDIPFLDLVQEGNRGLIQAAEKYDYTMGNRFSTYAVPWIDQALKRGCDNTISTIRVPVYVRDLRRKINRFSLTIFQATGETPSKETIMKALDITSDEYDRAQDIPYNVSLNRTINNDDESTIEDFVMDNTLNTPDENYQNEVNLNYIDELLSILNKNERFVIERRFGLFGNNVQTLRQLSQILNLSAERIRQIEREAIEKLKNEI